MALGPAQKAEIIDLIYERRGVPAAAEKAGIRLRVVMDEIDNDLDFQANVEKALRHLTSVGEQELMRRAIDGTESYVTSQGRIVNIVDEYGLSRPLIERKYSDSLLSQFLKARKKEVFGGKIEIEHTHKGHIAVPLISQADLLRAIESGSPLDFAPEIIDGEFIAVTDQTEEQEPDFNII